MSGVMWQVAGVMCPVPGGRLQSAGGRLQPYQPPADTISQRVWLGGDSPDIVEGKDYLDYQE